MIFNKYKIKILMDSIPDHPNKNNIPFDPIKYFNDQILNFEKRI